MSLKIQTNIESLHAQRQLITARTESEKVIQSLSSGKRISTAADDAAGLAVSMNLSAAARSLDQATRNGQDGISMIQVAEGGMNETGAILIRMRELGIQAASDTIGNGERALLNKEVFHLRDEIDRISKTTEYNGRKLLSGEFTWPSLEVQIGIHGEAEENRIGINRRGISTTLAHLGLTAIDFSRKSDAQEFLGTLDDAIQLLSKSRAQLGAMQNRFLSSIANNQIYSENIKGANSRIIDTEYASKMSEATKNKIMAEATMTVLAQANQAPNLALKLLG